MKGFRFVRALALLVTLAVIMGACFSASAETGRTRGKVADNSTYKMDSYTVTKLQPRLYLSILVKNSVIYSGDKALVSIMGPDDYKINYNAIIWHSSNDDVVKIVRGWPVANKAGVAVLTISYYGIDMGNVRVRVRNRMYKK